LGLVRIDWAGFKEWQAKPCGQQSQRGFPDELSSVNTVLAHETVLLYSGGWHYTISTKIAYKVFNTILINTIFYIDFLEIQSFFYKTHHFMDWAIVQAFSMPTHTLFNLLNIIELRYGKEFCLCNIFIFVKYFYAFIPACWEFMNKIYRRNIKNGMIR